VLLDTPDGTFWRHWMDFVDNAVIADHYIDENDMCLVRLCTSTEEAAGEIDHFFSNYVSSTYAEIAATSRFADVPTQPQLAALANAVPLSLRIATCSKTTRRSRSPSMAALRELATLD